MGHRLRSHRLKLLLIRPLNADLDLLAAESALHADVDRRDPRDGRQSGTHRGDQVLHGALALRAVFQLHKDRGVILTLQGAGIDRGVGEHRFRECAQRGFHLPRLFHCEIERRTHRGVELHKELVVVGLRYKLRPNLSAQGEGGYQRQQGQAQCFPAIGQTPAQHGHVAIFKPTHQPIEAA